MRLLRTLAVAVPTATIALGALGASAVPAHADTGFGYIYDVPTNCTGTNNTQKINALLASMPDGEPGNPFHVTFGAASNCFLLNDIPTPGSTDVSGLRIVNKKNWVVDGDATIRFANTVPTVAGRAVNRSNLTIVNGDHIDVTGLKLIGKKAKNTYDPKLEYDHNVTVLGGTWIRLNDVTMDGAAGDNIALKAFGANWPKVVSVYGSTLKNANRHNVSIQGANGVWLTNNTMVENDYWAIDAELSAKTWPMQNINVTGNTSTGSRYGFMALSSRTDATNGGVNGVTVKNNVAASTATNYEFLNINASAASNAPTANVTADGNRFTVRQYGMKAKYVTGLTVKNQRATTFATGSASDAGGIYPLVAMGSGVNTASITGNSFTRASSAPTTRHTTAWKATTGASPAPVGVTASANTVG